MKGTLVSVLKWFYKKKSRFYRGGVKMASKKASEVDKSEDLLQEVNLGEVVNAEDQVKR